MIKVELDIRLENNHTWRLELNVLAREDVHEQERNIARVVEAYFEAVMQDIAQRAELPLTIIRDKKGTQP